MTSIEILNLIGELKKKGGCRGDDLDRLFTIYDDEMQNQSKIYTGMKKILSNEIAELKNKLDVSDKTNAALSRENGDFLLDAQTLRRMNNQLKSKENDFEKEKENLNRQLSAVNDSVAVKDKKIIDLQKDNDLLASKQKFYVGQLDGHRDEIEVLKNENASLKTELDNVKIESESLNKKLDELKANGFDLNTKIGDLQDENRLLKNKIVSLNSQNADAKLRKENQELSDEIFRLRKYRNDSKNYEALTKNLEDGQKDLVKKTKALEKDKKTIDTEKTELKKKSKEVDELKWEYSGKMQLVLDIVKSKIPKEKLEEIISTNNKINAKLLVSEENAKDLSKNIKGLEVEVAKLKVNIADRDKTIKIKENKLKTILEKVDNDNLKLKECRDEINNVSETRKFKHYIIDTKKFRTRAEAIRNGFEISEDRTNNDYGPRYVLGIKRNRNSNINNPH